MPSVDTESAGGVLFYRGDIGGKPVVVARSGMGADRARPAARALIERYQPDSLLAVGFAGALSPDIVPGDLVIAAEVYDSHESDARLRAIAEQSVPKYVQFHTGLIHSVPHIVYAVEEKRRLAARFPQALALDMESEGVADEAARAGIPWLAVRAVTDGIEDSLPELAEPFRGLPCIDPGTGEVIPRRMALLVVFRPRVAPKLIQLGRRANLAARNLADFVESYVAAL